MSTGWDNGGQLGGVAGGDLGGTYPDPDVEKLQGVAVSDTAPTAGQVLKLVGGAWVPSTDATGLADAPNDGTLYARKSATWVQPAVADTTGTLALARGGTGATTQPGAANAVLPLQAGNASSLLTTNGSDVSWAAPSVFGTQYSSSERFTPLGTSAAPPGVSFLLHTTPSVPAGVYIVLLSYFLTGSAANTQLWTDLIVDGAPLSGPFLETGIANGRFVFGSALRFSWSAAAHTIELSVGRGGGSGTVTANGAVIQVWRIS